MADLRKVFSRKGFSRVTSLVRKSIGLDSREDIVDVQNCPQEGSEKLPKGEISFGSTQPHQKRPDMTEKKRICESDNCSETVPIDTDYCPRCFSPFTFERKNARQCTGIECRASCMKTLEIISQEDFPRLPEGTECREEWQKLAEGINDGSITYATAPVMNGFPMSESLFKWVEDLVKGTGPTPRDEAISVVRSRMREKIGTKASSLKTICFILLKHASLCLYFD